MSITSEVVRGYEEKILALQKTIAEHRAKDQALQGLRDERVSFELEIRTVMKIVDEHLDEGVKRSNPFDGASMRVHRVLGKYAERERVLRERLALLERLNEHLAEQLFEAKDALTDAPPIEER